MKRKTNGDLSAENTQTTFNQPQKTGIQMKPQYTPCAHCGKPKQTSHPYCSDQCERRENILSQFDNTLAGLKEINQHLKGGAK